MPVGMALIAIMAFYQVLRLFNYLPSRFWFSSPIAFLLIGGVVAELYGFWSGEKQMAFLVGCLPFIVYLLVANIGFELASSGVRSAGWVFANVMYLFFGLISGIMGFGGAKYRENRRWIWLVVVLIPAGLLLMLFL